MLVLSDHVRYTGQPIAAVAATSSEIAIRALELIEVEYEQLDTVFDPLEAIKDGAVQIHASARKYCQERFAICRRLGSRFCCHLSARFSRVQVFSLLQSAL